MLNNIAKLRRDRGITQEKLAEILGVTPVTVSRYENNLRGLNVNTLEIIATALNCSIVDLISDSDTTQQTVLHEDLLRRIIAICLKVIGEEAGLKLDSEGLSNVILELYQWAQKKENANDDTIEAYLSGALKHERRSAN